MLLSLKGVARERVRSCALFYCCLGLVIENKDLLEAVLVRSVTVRETVEILERMLA